jgi:hypothetical protein
MVEARVFSLYGSKKATPEKLAKVISGTHPTISNEEFIRIFNTATGTENSALKTEPVLKPKTKEERREAERLANMAAKQERERWNRDNKIKPRWR